MIKVSYVGCHSVQQQRFFFPAEAPQKPCKPTWFGFSTSCLICAWPALPLFLTLGVFLPQVSRQVLWNKENTRKTHIRAKWGNIDICPSWQCFASCSQALARLVLSSKKVSPGCFTWLWSCTTTHWHCLVFIVHVHGMLQMDSGCSAPQLPPCWGSLGPRAWPTLTVPPQAWHRPGPCPGGCSAGHQGVGPALRVVLRGSSPVQSCSPLPACVGGLLAVRRALPLTCRKAVQRGGAGTFETRAGVTKWVLTAGKIQKAHASTQAVWTKLSSLPWAPAKAMQETLAARSWMSLNSQVELPVSLPCSGLVSKPMGEGAEGQRHLSSPPLGRAGRMLSPRALVAAWLFSSSSGFAAGDKGKLSFTVTMPRMLLIVWVRRRHACADR